MSGLILPDRNLSLHTGSNANHHVGTTQPHSSSCAIVQLSAGSGAELAEAESRQSMELLIRRGGAPFCIMLCFVSQDDTSFAVRMQKHTFPSGWQHEYTDDIRKKA